MVLESIAAAARSGVSPLAETVRSSVSGEPATAPVITGNGIIWSLSF
jgi:hypothetical protein